MLADTLAQPVNTSAHKPIPVVPTDTTAEDHHAYVARLREQSPIVQSELGPYVLLNHAHALKVLEDGSTRQLETEAVLLMGIMSGPVHDLHANTMLFSNGETHARRRAPVARTFAFKLMDGMRGAIAQLTEDLIDRHFDAPETDFLHEIAGQIPARMIARILGVPEADLPRFIEQVYVTAQGLSLFPPEERAHIEEHTQALLAYVEDLLQQRRAEPREDFLSDYVRSVDSDGVLSDAEIRTQIASVILAGSDTTRLALCATLSQLLQHPDQWAALCADPDGLKKGAVEEGLRFDPPTSWIPRIALRDLDLDGYHIPAGSVVSPSLVAALRDPAVYEDPHRFDITRTDHPRWPIVFGWGAHRCLGEALARAELEEALAAIARRAPDIQLVGKPPRLHGAGGIRKIDGMTVCFRAVAAEPQPLCA